MSRRHRQPPQPRPQQDISLSPSAATMVLLGLIGSEAALRCRSEADRVEKMLDERLSFHEEHFPDDVEIWHKRQRLWRPVAALLEFLPTSTGALTAAPLVEISARPDAGDEQLIRFSICERGLIRVSTQKWPSGAPSPNFPPTPTTIAEALATARQVVAQAMTPLLAHADPMRIK